ncbi:hypothetical protein JCM16161A_23360 [Vulcanisaeta sp. JCM 16161]|uniref:hypothetical protein n=1 Tax=Vulcanisaeta sp. JCM 16161 TaxID=1295372 RepID=UPI00406CCCA1
MQFVYIVERALSKAMRHIVKSLIVGDRASKAVGSPTTHGVRLKARIKEAPIYAHSKPHETTGILESKRKTVSTPS